MEKSGDAESAHNVPFVSNLKVLDLLLSCLLLEPVGLPTWRFDRGWLPPDDKTDAAVPPPEVGVGPAPIIFDTVTADT